MLLLATLKGVVKKFWVIDNYCRDCGLIAEAFTVPNELWMSVTRGSEPLCFRCFDKQARTRKRAAVWSVDESF